MGALAFMSAGHAPGPGKYGRELDKALEFVVSRAKPSGLLNISHEQRDMYNHGLATFVLGQAHGMTTSKGSQAEPHARRGAEADRQHAVRRRRLGLSGSPAAARARPEPGRDAGQGPAERGR
jgi:hypothetical protein